MPCWSGRRWYPRRHDHVRRVRALCRRPGDSREWSVAEWLAAEGGGPAAAGGARETRSAAERDEEPSRGPNSGRGVRIFGLHPTAARLDAGTVGGAVGAG